MISNLVKVALLSIGASSNAILSTPPKQNAYITNDTPLVNTQHWLKVEDFTLNTYHMLPEGTASDRPYTTTTYTTTIKQQTSNNIKTTSLLLNAWQNKQSEEDIDKGELIDAPDRRPFFLSLTKYEIVNNANIVADVWHTSLDIWGGVDISFGQPILARKNVYSTYNTDTEKYMQTLWDYFDKNQSSIIAEDPFVYKNQLLNHLSATATVYYTDTVLNNWGEGEKLFVQGSTSTSDASTIYPNNTLYILNIGEIERYYKVDPVLITDPQYEDIFCWGYNDDQETVLGWNYKTWLYNQPTYEVIDIPNIMFTVISMPFTFMSKAFNVTLFPNTPYSINIANILLSIVGALTFIFIIKIVVKMTGK